MAHRASRTLILPASVALVAAVLLAPLVLVACNAGEQTLFEADPNAVAVIPRYDEVVAIIERNCVPCHKGGDDCFGADSEGEGEFDPSFDSCACIKSTFASFVLKVVDEGTMPPGAWPRLTEEQRLTLHNWQDAIRTGQACYPCDEGCTN